MFEPLALIESFRFLAFFILIFHQFDIQFDEAKIDLKLDVGNSLQPCSNFKKGKGMFD
jgi:hypothetical protein